MLSDYGKGGLAHIATMIERARAAGKPVLVDPKGDDCDALPRRDAASRRTAASSAQVAGRWSDEARADARKAQTLRAELDLEALLVTRCEEGMTLFTGDGALPRFRRSAREVYDVSRRGRHRDRHARRAARRRAPTRRAAVRIANQAAGIVVGKLGTAVVTPDELG